MVKNVVWTLLLSQSLFWLFYPWFLSTTDYLHPAALGVYNLILFCIIGFAVAILRRTKYQLHPIWYHLFIVFYGVLVWILLFIRPGSNLNRQINVIPFDTIKMYLSGDIDGLISFYNLVANVGLFIPFGIYLAFFIRSWSVKFFLPIVLISLIEISQLISSRGSMDIDDLILNLAGVWIGYLISPLLQKVLIINKRNKAA